MGIAIARPALDLDIVGIFIVEAIQRKSSVFKERQ
jgi:hypothetical protein